MVIHKWHNTYSGKKIVTIKRNIPVMWGASTRGSMFIAILISMPIWFNLHQDSLLSFHNVVNLSKTILIPLIKFL